MLAKGRTIRSWGGRGRQILKTNSCTDFTGKKKILQMNSGGEKSYRASKDHQQKVFISCHKTKRSQSEDHLLYSLGNPTFRPIFTLQFRKICVIHFLGMGMRKRQFNLSYYFKCSQSPFDTFHTHTHRTTVQIDIIM